MCTTEIIYIHIELNKKPRKNKKTNYSKTKRDPGKKFQMIKKPQTLFTRDAKEYKLHTNLSRASSISKAKIQFSIELNSIK